MNWPATRTPIGYRIAITCDVIHRGFGSRRPPRIATAECVGDGLTGEPPWRLIHLKGAVLECWSRGRWVTPRQALLDATESPISVGASLERNGDVQDSYASSTDDYWGRTSGHSHARPGGVDARRSHTTSSICTTSLTTSWRMERVQSPCTSSSTTWNSSTIISTLDGGTMP